MVRSCCTSGGSEEFGGVGVVRAGLATRRERKSVQRVGVCILFVIIGVPVNGDELAGGSVDGRLGVVDTGPTVTVVIFDSQLDDLGTTAYQAAGGGGHVIRGVPLATL